MWFKFNLNEINVYVGFSYYHHFVRYWILSTSSKYRTLGIKMCNGCAKIDLRESLFKSIFSFKKVRIFTYSSIIIVLEINVGIPRIGMHYSLKGSIDVCCSCFMVLQLRTAGIMVLTKEQSIHLFYFSNKKVHHSRRRRKNHTYTYERAQHTRKKTWKQKEVENYVFEIKL